jgi:putative ABC transport system permease protein
VRGRKVVLGVEAAEALGKVVGDSLELGDRLYQIIGIYQTGNSFEDRIAVLPLEEAQILHNRPQQVSLIYIQLKDPD